MIYLKNRVLLESALLLVFALSVTSCAGTHINRGLAYDKNKEYLKAIEEYTRAIDKDQSPVNAYLYRGLSYERSHQNAKALEDYNKAIELDPESALAFDRRGKLLFYRLDEQKRGCRDFSRACELGACYHLNFYKLAGQC